MEQLLLQIIQQESMESNQEYQLLLQKKDLKKEKMQFSYQLTLIIYTEMSEKAMEVMKESADIFEYVGRDEAYLGCNRES